MDKEKAGDIKEESKRCGHGGHCGCGIKVIGAIVLILLGWICGYMMGGRGGLCGKNKGMCDHSSMSAMAGCPMTPQDMPASKTK